MATKTEKHNLWICQNGEPQYFAWIEWLLASGLWKAKQFRPKALTVPAEWPPETEADVGSTLAHFAAIRELAAKDKGCQPLRQVPVYAQPWVRAQSQIGRTIAAHNAEQNPPTQPPRDMGHITRLLASSGLVPWYRESYKPDAARMQKRELSESEKAELDLRESALRTERAEKLSAKLPRYVPGANE